MDCAACASGYVDYPLCTRCTSEEHCNGRASAVDSKTPNGTECVCHCTHQWTGDRCEICPQNFAGLNCSDCASGYVNYPACRECTDTNDCSGNAVLVTSDVARKNCLCTCRNQWEGGDCGVCDSKFYDKSVTADPKDSCGSCAPLYYNYPLCVQCTNQQACNGRARSNPLPDPTQKFCVCECSNRWTDPQCGTCPSKYGGANCDQCAVGRVHFDQCTLCTAQDACSDHASDVTSTDVNGKQQCHCTCRNQWHLDNCSACAVEYDANRDCGACRANRINYPVCAMCTSLNCNGRSYSVSANAAQNGCDCVCRSSWTGDSCGTCPPQFTGTDCDVCATGFTGYPLCTECTTEHNCSSHAKVLGDGKALVTSDRDNTRCVCECRHQWSGDSCETCIDIYNASRDCAVCSEGRVSFPICTLCTNGMHCNTRAVRVVPNHNSTACVCTCRNFWTGLTCATCPPQYGGDDCNTCAPNYYGKEPNCSRVQPGKLQMLGGSNGFQYLGKPMNPPPTMRLIDVTGRQIIGSGEKDPPECECTVRECGPIGSKGCSNATWCLSSATPQPGENISCTVVATERVKLGSVCECKNLVIPPPPEEVDVGNKVLALNGLHVSLVAWHVPRYYELTVELLPLAHVNGTPDNETLFPSQVITMPLRQPCCDDNCGLNPTQMVVLRNASKTCVDCPEGLKCDGSTVTLTQDDFWREGPEVLVPSRCTLPNCDGTKVSDEGNVRHGCSQGSGGVLCGECEEGYRLGYGGCSKCNSLAQTILLTAASVAGLLIGVLLYIRMQLPREVRRPDEIPQYLKIVVSAIQVLGELRNLDLNWGDLLPTVFSTSAAVSDTGGIPSPLFCLLPLHVSLTTLTIAWIALPLFLLLEALLATALFSESSATDKEQGQIEVLQLCSHCQDWADNSCDNCTGDSQLRCHNCAVPCRARGHKLFPCVLHGEGVKRVPLPKRQVFVISYLVLVHICFTVLARQLTKPFVCVQYFDIYEGFVRVTRDDARVSCESSFWLFKVALLFFFVYGIGFPVLFMLALRREKENLGTQRCVTTYGFLYINYRKKHYYWESVILLRKVLVVLAVALPTTTYSKAFATTWVIFIALVLNLFFRPYRDIDQQRLDDSTLFSGASCLLAALWLAERQKGGETSGDPLSDPMLIVVAVLNGISLLLCVRLIFSAFRRKRHRIRGWLKELNVRKKHHRMQWRSREPQEVQSGVELGAVLMTFSGTEMEEWGQGPRGGRGMEESAARQRSLVSAMTPSATARRTANLSGVWRDDENLFRQTTNGGDVRRPRRQTRGQFVQRTDADSSRPDAIDSGSQLGGKEISSPVQSGSTDLAVPPETQSSGSPSFERATTTAPRAHARTALFPQNRSPELGGMVFAASTPSPRRGEATLGPTLYERSGRPSPKRSGCLPSLLPPAAGTGGAAAPAAATTSAVQL
eukprot:TRINITY_DN26474_c0_g1_i1.p1 TRINITY_DN26474_c0_g1~~TRINITY_DN26474_c0_g1_i1.p1  ORF type:complete len:1550 (+),score=342.94 TRINITY_DN26474_c0_g1_i1:359-4651(+)